MEIFIDNRYSGSSLEESGFDADAFCRLARFDLEQEGAPTNSELSISLVDNDEIAALNEEYRGKQGPTDVLSFECDDPWDEDLVACAESVAVGDIVIAPDVARSDAPEYGVGFMEEMELLLTHGVLHLLGYDHIDPDEAKEMEARQLDLLDAWRAGLEA